MARAVMRLFDGVQLAFGPTIDNGFYYDFDLPHKLSEEDFPAIEAEMAKIVKLRRAVRADRGAARRGDRDLPRPGPDAQGRAHRDRAGRPADGVVLPSGRVHRSLPRAARAQRRRDRRVQAAVGGRGLLEGRRPRQQLQRLYATAWFTQGGTRRPPENGRGGQAPRPSRAGQAARTVHHQSAGRAGLDPVAAQGGHRPRPAGELSTTS